MPAPVILVVDDQPINVQLLKRKLEREGITVTTAYNGGDALAEVERQRPDLILLDVMMPDMDGIEVCSRLQANAETRTIPIIFITARTTKEGKIEGLGAGAVDYITKPIDLDETMARVRTQLRVVQMNRDLLELQQRLAESRRSAAVAAITQGIAHNLNNLLGIVIGYMDLVRAFHDKPEQVARNIAHADEAVQRIVSIIRQLSSLLVKVRPPSTKLSLQALLNESVQRYQGEFGVTQAVEIENPLGELMIDSNAEIFEEALSKVLINAWESYEDKPAEMRPIRIRTRLFEKPEEGMFVEICVEDRGCGVDGDLIDHVFEPFISSKRTVGVGMGLTIARHSLRGLGGDAHLRNRPDGGAVAILEHPVERKQTKLVQGK